MKEPHRLPEQTTLNAIFHYDAETGDLLFKARTPDMFSVDSIGRSAAYRCRIFNTRFAGKRAASVNGGYLCVKVEGVTYKAHRIIWMMVYGKDPATIDHINRNTSDNRIANLRDVSTSQNCLNKRKQSNNKSGVPGVHLEGISGKWRATIDVDRARIHLGRFPTKDEAVNARALAEANLVVKRFEGMSS